MKKANRPLKPRRVYVSEDQWRRIKAHCALEGISISEWIRRSIAVLVLGILLAVSVTILLDSSIKKAIIALDKSLDW